MKHEIILWISLGEVPDKNSNYSTKVAKRNMLNNAKYQLAHANIKSSKKWTEI